MAAGRPQRFASSPGKATQTRMEAAGASVVAIRGRYALGGTAQARGDISDAYANPGRGEAPAQAAAAKARQEAYRAAAAGQDRRCEHARRRDGSDQPLPLANAESLELTMHLLFALAAFVAYRARARIRRQNSSTPT
jgi:hypothetical protein